MANVEQLRAQALTLHRDGRLVEAEQLYRQVLSIDPRDGNTLHLLGVLAHECGRGEAAVQLIRRAIALAPTPAQAPAIFLHNLGEAYAGMGAAREALTAYASAIALDSGLAAPRKGAANVLAGMGRMTEAAEHCRAAMRLAPTDGEIASNLASILADSGRMDEAIEARRHALALSPGSALIHSNLLRDMIFLPQTTAADLAEAQRQWWQAHGVAAATGRAFANSPDPQRRLRVGYVSADFYAHSVAYFMAPLLAAHDPATVETFCYSDVHQPDAVTRRMQSAAGHWRRAVGWTDAQLAQQIRADGIDVLVDLGGHTSRNRLSVFATRPAPVQISYLGYPLFTGVETVDCRISDGFVDPVDAPTIEGDRIMRVAPCAWCYSPPAEAPAIDREAVADGPFTFGSFNHLAKMSDACVEVWSRLLSEVPESRLVLKSASLVDGGVREHVLGRFTRHGIKPARIELLGRDESPSQHLARYATIDVALDPFPYNGTTTTCEALWMTVPVVTLAGTLPHARVGVSLLQNLRSPELIAADERQYVDIAKSLASSSPHRRALRAGNRGRMRVSPLMDEQRLAREIERVMRELWTKWCRERG